MKDCIILKDGRITINGIWAYDGQRLIVEENMNMLWITTKDS